MSWWRRPGGGDDDGGNDDDDDSQPLQTWPGFIAELAPRAMNDLLAMRESNAKTAIISVLRGDDPNSVIKDMNVSIEALADPQRGWSVLRVGGISIFYKPLTTGQARDLDHLADILVARIGKLDELE